MASTSRAHAPRLHRLLIWFLASVLTLLFYWAVDFVVSDIGRIDGPQREDVRDEIGDAALRDELDSLQEQQADLQTQISNQEDIQRVLSRSTAELRSTMDQLIDLHRLDIEAGVTPTDERQQALAESQSLFIAKQVEFQLASEAIGKQSQEQRTVAARIQALDERRRDDDERVHEEFESRLSRHRLKLAAFKLTFVLPALALGAWLVFTRRKQLYAPIYYAWLIATFVVMTQVMWQYFPRAWFKYIAVGAGIAVVTLFLVQAVRMVARPRRDLLLRRYREAYGRHRCPVCTYQIVRGPLKHAVWTAKGPMRGSAASGDADETPYTCPSCGSGLYHECDSCGSVRHTLLPYCDSCGDEHAAAEA
ncbi:hypothetical protein CMK11_05980 [Candidatus Poribacteria bacterium]|nr:hypothetical protein [Candidatus Poribacteria bacterium]